MMSSSGAYARSPAVEAVAVLGLACRLPGASDTAQLWARMLPADRTAHIDSSGAGRLAGPLPRFTNVDHFDPEFFELSDAEAALIDPQHRHFLTCLWQALEDAGIDPFSDGHLIGLFAGCAMSSHLFAIMENPRIAHTLGPTRLRHAVDKDYLVARAGRLANLRGPCVAVQAGCATGLAALHLACSSLASGECDVAIAGAVSIRSDPTSPFHAGEKFLSSDGCCRSFDATATGTVYGDGVGVLVLKLADRAVADGDNIRAVILGTALNNSGRSSAALHAPDVAAQRSAAEEALHVAGIGADSIGFVEGHGFGTVIGDAMELKALSDAYRERGATEARRIPIGSVKAEIGHLGTAASVAALIKVVLALERGAIPAQPSFGRENEHGGLDRSPFFVPRVPCSWPSGGLRRAAVNSFSMTGANGHAVLEEAPRDLRDAEERAVPRLLLFSARDRKALDELEERVLRQLEGSSSLTLRDASFTLQTGRRRFPHRRAVTAIRRGEGIESLGQRRQGELDPKRPLPTVSLRFSDCVVAPPPGAASLAEWHPACRETVDALTAAWRSLEGSQAVNPLLVSSLCNRIALYELFVQIGVSVSEVTGVGVGSVIAQTCAMVSATDRSRVLARLDPELLARPARQAVIAVAGDRGEGADVFVEIEQENAGDRLNIPLRCHAASMHDLVGPLLDGLGQLWVGGVELRWPALFAGERPRRAALPPYPLRERPLSLAAWHKSPDGPRRSATP